MTPQEQAALARRRLAEAHTRRRGDLHLVPPGLVLPAESPQDHIRNALQLIHLAWTRATEMNLIGCPELVELLEGAEARCFHALFGLERTLDSDLREDR